VANRDAPVDVNPLRTVGVDACPVCGGSGPILYRRLHDRVFHVPGIWSMRRCEDCWSLWLDPRPIGDDLHRAYESYFTHQAAPLAARRSVKAEAAARLRVLRDVGTDAYIARRFGYQRSGPVWTRLLALVVGMWPGRRLDAEFKVMRLSGADIGRLLDVGCGDGAVLAALDARGWEVQGLDFDPEAVAVARARGLKVDVGELSAQCYPADTFAAVTMSHSLEHLPDPAATLHEVWRILAPGGRVVIVTPNAASWLHRRYGSDWQPLEPPRHLQIFTRGALQDLARAASFVQIDTVTTARSANGVARAAWKFRRHGFWDMSSRPSLAERVIMEMIQQFEARKVRSDPDAGEELVLTAVKDQRSGL
jgi:2-polyprenyl-3-methyl-5-hydroxy-6-metoxy-1,4-benzoquinol methylase